MFNFQAKIEEFKTYYREHGQAYNNAASMTSFDDPAYEIVIEKPQNPIWRVLGIHHLAPAENKAANEDFGKHNVYIEMLCKQNDREGFRAIHWTWIGRQSNEPARDVFAGQKPHDELVDLPLNLGMIVSVWTNGSEIVKGLSSNYPDEGDGNTIGHHSYFVCFQELGDNGGTPLPDPVPDPDPPPIPGETTVILINKDWLNQQPVDDDGFIRISK